MINWPLAFGITLLVEAGVLFLLFRKEASPRRILATALVGNILTHPVIWFVIPRLVSTYGTYIILAEAIAFAVEVPVIVWLIRPDPWYMSIAGSALANGASYVVGLTFHYLA